MEQVITDANFQEYLDKGTPMIVDFWAPWCGPCRSLAPVVEEIAGEYEGRLIVGKCNVDDAVDIPAQFGIRNIPTILFFKDGQLTDRLVGAVPKQNIVEKIDAML